MSLDLAELPERQEIPRDQWGRPFVIPKGGGKPVAYQRMTTFIDVLGDKTNLVDWKARMVLFGANILNNATDDFMEDVEKAREAGSVPKGNALVEKALQWSGANDKSQLGTYLHGLSELVDEGKPLPDTVSDEHRETMASYMEMTMDMTPIAMERLVVVESLAVAGTPDRIMHYEGPGPNGKPISGNFIFDTKTGSVTNDPLKIAMQLAGYSRAEHYDFTRYLVPAGDKAALREFKKRVFTPEEATPLYESLVGVNQEWGIVLSLPSDGSAPSLWWADLTMGWEAAQIATQVREWRRKGKKALKAFA